MQDWQYKSRCRATHRSSVLIRKDRICFGLTSDWLHNAAFFVTSQYETLQPPDYLNAMCAKWVNVSTAKNGNENNGSDKSHITAERSMCHRFWTIFQWKMKVQSWIWSTAPSTFSKNPCAYLTLCLWNMLFQYRKKNALPRTIAFVKSTFQGAIGTRKQSFLQW